MLSEKQIQSVQSYIDEHYIPEKPPEECAQAGGAGVFPVFAEGRKKRRPLFQLPRTEKLGAPMAAPAPAPAAAPLAANWKERIQEDYRRRGKR